MDNDTQKILEEQLAKLPKEVTSFILSSSWGADADEIGSLYNLSREELLAFKREVVFVLAGLIHPDEFSEVVEQEIGIKGAILEALVANVEKKIFAPIRPALVEFFEKESATDKQKEVSVKITEEQSTEAAPEQEIAPTTEPPAAETREFTSPFSAIIQPTPVKTWEKAPEVVPENLPTEETTESFLPNLTPKTINPEPTPTPAAVAEPEGHPFEEKMKKVFTAGQQSMGELVIEQATSKTSPTYHVDPYREPIE